MPLDWLGIGIYTIPEAAGLVEATQPELRIWIEGRSGKQKPIIENDLGRLGKRVAISFTNLMELRFVALFSNAGVRLNEIRSILDEAKNSLRHPHPFATSIVLKQMGERLLQKLAARTVSKTFTI